MKQHDKCISYSTITKYIRSYKTFKTVEYEESTPNFHDLKIVNEKFLNVLDEEPFASFVILHAQRAFQKAQHFII